MPYAAGREDDRLTRGDGLLPAVGADGDGACRLHPHLFELAQRLGVTKQAAGQLVDDLEQRGYVRREPHPAGGRRKLVVLTDAARTHLAVAGRVLHGLEAELGDRLRGTDGTGEGVDLARVRSDLARIVRELAGESLPPLRPVW
ncbi:MAG: MarR family winged helix-turn-helix transcriptional regulator [Streptomyces sp.]|uniref:MarR family winged helix-turn-helix transcriptional regulator n=1 Tax=Streptomyces sp. TaxID=1931 RepID=UPI003D6A6434